MQHSSLEIQVLTCDAIYYISGKIKDLPMSFLKSTICGLLPLSKEKNTALKFGAEMALVSLLKSGNDRFQVGHVGNISISHFASACFNFHRALHESKFTI